MLEYNSTGITLYLTLKNSGIVCKLDTAVTCKYSYVHTYTVQITNNLNAPSVSHAWRRWCCGYKRVCMYIEKDMRGRLCTHSYLANVVSYCYS